ncbi:MAG: aminopeptidase [Nanoarchaeota archaeon]
MVSADVVKTVLSTCLRLKSKESCLIVTDTIKQELARPFYYYAKTITENARLAVMEPRSRNGEEPTEEIRQLMLKHDVQILLTDKSLSHTDARRKASATGARITTMPGISEEIMERCIPLDYQALKERNRKLRETIIGSHDIHITTPAGTDMHIAVTETHGESPGIYTECGAFGNLPSGEVDSGVVLEKTYGTLVVDKSMAGLGKLNSPLKITIKDGKAVSIEGERSDELKEMLDAIGADAYIIAELGIGTNDKAIVSGKTLEDEKVLGTFHMALGNDVTYGGHNDVPIHLDGVCANPTIIIDGRRVMEDGKLLID